ncbi:hypothetical protein GCM10011510_18850 [Streptococcus himalayensis]|uniref:Uncharacterized protein n=2 Tax=Streptococcus himalayensis TaxID=1888195 RepID=A0A917EFU7_9STRE|nr:hypothetical protein [Streptococcus himalayensis]GGE37741.1 hypothetical protein GCM10011510_18850 [Streptococcus himalayensis]
MKKFLKMILNRMHEFVSNQEPTTDVSVNQADIFRVIRIALQRKSGIHVIFSDKSFTGDIVKYDEERQQLIVKNFKKNISTIIRISDIKRIRLVPDTISQAQKRADS